ncbi:MULTISPECIES: type I polyketide synthase [Saccharothrix]|uniref:type I polyketide synthase n=1 Tax=Saccharothrix TaxID=2071 RepID=UPI00093F111B|nr:type I polyketide synthase [Saccharothrix sp. CB00851]OKI27900.1 beta-ketoacyl synthase [Saccharothrix sp. CB00851]
MTAVAVIGMAARLPGADDVREFWALLRGGVEGISRFDPDDLIRRGADPDYVRRPNFVPAMGTIREPYHFDWSFFGYSRAEAANIDPQQRVFLQAATAALDDAAIDPTRFPGWIGVYAGADKVAARADDQLSELAQYIGTEKDFLATRVAYKLGLRGPAVTVQSACSTSLVAVHLAATALRGGECDVALAGGVAVTGKGEWGYLYEPGGILSRDGHCRPFDADADGTVPSEGVGVVVLKRLDDALRDGDRVDAVILGSAINNDGGEKMGYTAPSIPGQSDVIRYTQQVADVDPADLDYVEAHGTATKLGDPVEVSALTDVFRDSTDATGWCHLGAVKSNLGHTGSAAGVAGLIKTVLMLKHGELVPTLHYGSPNPLLDLDATPFRVVTTTQPWPDRGTRLASVSSFGVGGTNAHVIVQGAPPRTAPVARDGARVLALSAASTDALGRMRDDLARALRSEPKLDLPEVARTLADRRAHGHRQAFVAGDATEAGDLLAAAGEPAPPGRLDKVAFLFPGQGTLESAAGAAAHRLLPGFRRCFDEIREVVAERHGVDLTPVVDPSAADTAWFADTVHQQLGLFALGWALGRQVADWSVRPAAMLGNSIGEYAQATLAGVWRPADAAELVFRRATAMAALEPGRMVAVKAPAEEVARRLGDGGDVTICIVGPGSVVVGGLAPAVDEVLRGGALHGLDVRVLNMSRASHSPVMAPAAEVLAALVTTVPGARPGVRLVSNTTGDWADPDEITGPAYWADQLRLPVRLDRGLGTLLASGCDTFLELGPGTSMTGALRRHRDWDTGHTTIPLLGRPEDTERSLLRALGTLWERGADVALDDLRDDVFPVSLPTYSFTPHDPQQGSAQLGPAAPQGKPGATPTRKPAGQPVRSTALATAERLWRATLGTDSVAADDDFFALGGESLMAVDFTARLREEAGLDITVTEFTRDPRFGALAALAERADSAVPRAVDAVVLHGGTGRPFVLIADAAGGALAYRTLTEELGDHALYCLEPRGPLRGGIARQAAHHVEALRRVLPHGPYALGGWSFGAVLAHEVARQLEHDGETVDAVVALDAYVQGRRGVPIGVDPGFVYSRIRTELDAALGLGPVGAQVRRNPALRRLLRTKAAALATYVPGPVAARAVVFRTGTSDRAARRLEKRLAPLYRGGVRVRPVGGDHWSVLGRPHVRDLAEDLREIMIEAERVQ